MKSKKNLCIMLALLITVSAFGIVAYASSETVTSKTLGNHYTNTVTCKTLVAASLTTYSNYAYGYIQCYVDGAWNDVPDCILSKNGKTSDDYTPDELNDLFGTSKSTYACRGRLYITVPSTTYTNYVSIVSNY